MLWFYKEIFFILKYVNLLKALTSFQNIFHYNRRHLSLQFTGFPNKLSYIVIGLSWAKYFACCSCPNFSRVLILTYSFPDVTDLCDLRVYQWQAAAACPGLCIAVPVSHPCYTTVPALHCGSFCSQGYHKVSGPSSFSYSWTLTFHNTTGKVLEKKIASTCSSGRGFRGGTLMCRNGREIKVTLSFCCMIWRKRIVLFF